MTSHKSGWKWVDWCYQGQSWNSIFCTMSDALCVLHERLGMLVLSSELTKKMHYLLTLQFGQFYSFHPEQFHGLLLPTIWCSSFDGQVEYCGDIEIKVHKHESTDVNPYIYDEEFILFDSGNTETPCMRVMKTVVNETDNLLHYLCRSNVELGPKSKRYCYVNVNKPTVTIYKIQTSFKGRGWNHLKRDDSFYGTTKWIASYCSFTSTKWLTSSLHIINRTLQCKCYAVSECCKELYFLVAPETIQSHVITQMAHIYKKNVVD